MSVELDENNQYKVEINLSIGSFKNSSCIGDTVISKIGSNNIQDMKITDKGFCKGQHLSFTLDSKQMNKLNIEITAKNEKNQVAPEITF